MDGLTLKLPRLHVAGRSGPGHRSTGRPSQSRRTLRPSSEETQIQKMLPLCSAPTFRENKNGEGFGSHGLSKGPNSNRLITLNYYLKIYLSIN